MMVTSWIIPENIPCGPKRSQFNMCLLSGPKLPTQTRPGHHLASGYVIRLFFGYRRFRANSLDLDKIALRQDVAVLPFSLQKVGLHPDL